MKNKKTMFEHVCRNMGNHMVARGYAGINFVNSNDFADIQDFIYKWNEETVKELNTEKYCNWRMICYPIIRNQIIFVLELDCEDRKAGTNRYRFWKYDIQRRKLAESYTEIELENEELITVVDVNDENISMLLCDDESDEFRVSSCDKEFEIGAGVTRCVANKNGLIAVGYDREATIDNGGNAVIIYDKNGNEVYPYNDESAVACLDIYTDDTGAFWIHPEGKNVLEKLENKTVTTFKCAMSGFDGFVISPDAKYLHLSYDVGRHRDRMYRLQLSRNTYQKPEECVFNSCGYMHYSDISTGYGYGVYRHGDCSVIIMKMNISEKLE